MASQELVHQSATEQWLSQQTGVEIAERDGRRVISIPPTLADKVNLLTPVSQVQQMDTNYSPTPRLIHLNPDPTAGDVYKESGGLALSAKALSKIADMAGVEHVDTIIDDMSGTGVRMTVVGRKRGPDGQWRLKKATKTVRFAALERKITRETKAKNAKATDEYIQKRIDDEMDHIDAKALAHGTPVLTPGGWVHIEDLRVGDLVVGRNGQPTVVMAVWPQGERDLYDVRFTDGTVVRCCGDHRWTVTCNNWQRERHETWQVRTTDELRAVKSRFHVPLAGVVQFAPVEAPPVDPWLIGALIGDGNLTRRGMVRIALTENEMVTRVREALPPDTELVQDHECNWRLRCREYALAHDSGPGRKAHSVLTYLRGSGLHGHGAWTKRVPAELLWGSPATRLAVLQGIADTDGCVARLAQASITTVSSGLADDIAFLVWSLGGRTKRGYNGHAHSVRFSIPGMVPFRLARKAEKYIEQVAARKDRRDWRTIESIAPAGRGEASCITVSAEDSMFLTTNLVPTNNCETKAWNRVVRGFLAIKSTYSAAEMQRPFLAIAYSFTPDYANPGSRALLELNHGVAQADVYGALPAAGTSQGSRVVLDLDEAEQLDDEPDDEPEEDWESEPTELESTDPEPVFPEPEAFSFKAGPYKDQNVRDVVVTRAGRGWLAHAALKMKPEKRVQAISWLEWAEQRPMSDEHLESLAVGLSAE